MRMRLAVLALWCGLLSGGLVAENKAVTVTTKLGVLQGASQAGGEVVVFKGVPYAQPPVGELRWRAPQPAQPWSGVRQAQEFGASCAQSKWAPLPWTSEFLTQNDVSEDCLFLNVWAPATATKKHPVLVYIHGGGFSGGSGEVPVYDGANLARLGLVVVTINYRLGALGFLATPELTAEAAHGASGSYGLQDQVAALEWVKQNIAAFGGDPANVTLSGQSAGAASVLYLMASPRAKGLFHKAIVISGPGFLRVAHKSRAEAEQAGKKFMAKKAATLAEARKLSAESLLPKSWATRFEPGVDGWFLPEEPGAVFAKGQAMDIPLMTGSTADDSAGFAPPAPLADYAHMAQEKYGELAARFLELYPAKSDAEARTQQAAAERDRMRASAYLLAVEWNGKRMAPLYTYYFDRATPWPEHPEFGAFHTSDVPYSFANLKLVNHPYTEADHKLSATMAQYWVNFAATGDPNGKGLPAWKAAKSGVPETQQLGERVGPMPVADAAKLRFWADYFAAPISKSGMPI